MRNIGMDLVRVTEAAAISASALIGSGNKLEADRLATDAMRDRLNKMKFCGRIRIGEGKKDQSHGLYKDEVVGSLQSAAADFSEASYDIAVDPIDGTTQTVNAGPEALSVLAVSEPNSMFDTEEHYMLKLAVNQDIAKKAGLSLADPLPEICRRLADARGKSIDKLMVCILNRPRHEQYIAQMRELGVRMKLIPDCDISGAIATCLPDSGVDMLYGVGGAPEAVLTAAALKCLGGTFEGRIWRNGEACGKILGINDMVRGHCCFAATGITNGSLLRGVRWNERGPITHSVFMRSESRTVRWMDTWHGN